VYDSLGDLMQREVHALTMTLLAPGEGSAGTAAP
jgi:acid stress-induced BolA-like protein IbaG/YrbA